MSDLMVKADWHVSVTTAYLKILAENLKAVCSFAEGKISLLLLITDIIK